jgi:hypothetical protein
LLPEIWLLVLYDYVPRSILDEVGGNRQPGFKPLCDGDEMLRLRLSWLLLLLIPLHAQIVLAAPTPFNGRYLGTAKYAADRGVYQWVLDVNMVARGPQYKMSGKLYVRKIGTKVRQTRKVSAVFDPQSNALFG